MTHKNYKYFTAQWYIGDRFERYDEPLKFKRAQFTDYYAAVQYARMMAEEHKALVDRCVVFMHYKPNDLRRAVREAHTREGGMWQRARTDRL